MGEFIVCKLPINKAVRNSKRIFSMRLSLMWSCRSLCIPVISFGNCLKTSLTWKLNMQSSVYFNCSKNVIVEVNNYFLFSYLHASCWTKGKKGAIALMYVTEMFASVGCLGHHSLWLSQSIKIPGWLLLILLWGFTIKKITQPWAQSMKYEIYESVLENICHSSDWEHYTLITPVAR